MYDLNNKIVIITGAANGIGASISRELLKEGVKHIRLLDVDEQSGISLQNELNMKHGADKAKFVKCDITNDDLLFGVLNEVVEEYGHIDLLINNAGIAVENTSAAIRKEIEINFTATVNGTIKGLELMRKDQGKSGGTIINVSSIAALMQMCPMLFVYNATKSAVLHFSNCVGKEAYYSATGVRVLTVCFGYTDTALVKGYKSFDDNVQKYLQSHTLAFPSQSLEAAASGTMEVYKKGKSGSTWLIQNDKPAKEITSSVNQAYDILTNVVKSDV